MKSLSLEEVIKQEIKNLREGKVSQRVKTFASYGSKYAIPKSEIKAEITLGEGIVASIDISDFFKEELK